MPPSPPLTDEEMAQARNKHQREPERNNCWECYEPWPCPTIRLLDEVVARRNDLNEMALAVYAASSLVAARRMVDSYCEKQALATMEGALGASEPPEDWVRGKLRDPDFRREYEAERARMQADDPAPPQGPTDHVPQTENKARRSETVGGFVWKVRRLLVSLDLKLVESDAGWHERSAAGDPVGWAEGRDLRAAQELRVLATIMRAAMHDDAAMAGGGEDV